MRISIGQILILFLVIFLLFGDLKKAKKKVLNTLKNISNIFDKKNRKKGT